MDPHPGNTPTPAEELTLTLRRARHGGWSITAPAAPAFRASARTPPELARAVQQAARAVQATPAPPPPRPRTSDVPDLDQLMLTSSFSRAEVFGGLRRKHDPAAWQPLTGGWWLSPGGKRYRPGSAQVVKVIAQRKSLGLPIRHDADATLDLEDS